MGLNDKWFEILDKKFHYFGALPHLFCLLSSTITERSCNCCREYANSVEGKCIEMML